MKYIVTKVKPQMNISFGDLKEYSGYDLWCYYTENDYNYSVLIDTDSRDEAQRCFDTETAKSYNGSMIAKSNGCFVLTGEVYELVEIDEDDNWYTIDTAYYDVGRDDRWG